MSTAKYIKNGLLLLLTAATCFYAVTIHTTAREGNGPYWYFSNADPSYAFLMGSLCMADLKKTRFLYHPGVTPHLVGAAAIRVAHAVQNDGKALASSVIENPEHYITIISTTLLMLYLATLAWVSVYTIFYAKNMLLTVCVLASPFVRNATVSAVYPDFFGFTCESVSPFLMNLLLLAIVVSYRHAQQNSIPPRSVSALTGVLAIAGALNKIPFAPAFLLSFLLQGNKERRKIWLLAAVGSCFVLGLPLLASVKGFLRFVGGIVRNSGMYGSGEKGVINFFQIAGNFRIYFNDMPLSTVLLITAILVLLWAVKDKKTPERRFLAYLIVTFLVTLVMALKSYFYRYTIVLNYLTPLLVFFIYEVLKNKIKGINRNILCAGAVAVVCIFPYQYLTGLPAEDTHSRDIRNMHAYISNTYPELDRDEFIITPQVSSLANALAFGQEWARGPYLDTLFQRFPKSVFYRHGDFRDIRGHSVDPDSLSSRPLFIWGSKYIFGSEFINTPKEHEKTPQVLSVTDEAFKNLRIEVLHIEGSQLLGKIVDYK